MEEAQRAKPSNLSDLEGLRGSGLGENRGRPSDGEIAAET
jgi:hypothetical protein